MPRLRILLVGALVAATVTVWAGPAQARGSDFCDTANELYDDATSVDPLESLDPEELQAQIDDAIDAYKQLEKEAPRKLRKAFRVNRKYLESFQDLDFEDPDAFEDLIEDSNKVIRASQKIVNYLIDECGLDVPEIPDVSIPDVSIPDISIPE